MNERTNERIIYKRSVGCRACTADRSWTVFHWHTLTNWSSCYTAVAVAKMSLRCDISHGYRAMHGVLDSWQTNPQAAAWWQEITRSVRWAGFMYTGRLSCLSVCWQDLFLDIVHERSVADSVMHAAGSHCQSTQRPPHAPLSLDAWQSKLAPTGAVFIRICCHLAVCYRILDADTCITACARQLASADLYHARSSFKPTLQRGQSS